jgi:hypothetical protein
MTSLQSAPTLSAAFATTSSNNHGAAAIGAQAR